MKKSCMYFAMIIMFVIAATPAYAGIMSSVGNWALDNLIGVVLTGIFTIVAGFYGGTAWGKMILKSKVPIQELKDVIIKVHNARRPSSLGGSKITNEEKDAILKEVEELIQSIVTTFGKPK